MHILILSLFTLSLEIILTYLLISFPILPQIRRDIQILSLIVAKKKGQMTGGKYIFKIILAVLGGFV